MATLTTGSLLLPDEIIVPWLKKIEQGSTVATLSSPAPMKFGTEKALTFSIGEAEYVGEGADKSGSTVTPSTVTVSPKKFQKTVRWSDEVKWADEDHQLNVLSQVLDLIAPSLARALDFGVYHGLDPLGGSAPITPKLSGTTNSVEVKSADPYTYLDAADALVLAAGYNPKDIAIDPSWAASFASLRGTQSEQKLYPDFTLATEPVGRLDGHNSSVSNTVRAANVATTPTEVKAFVGDFDTIRWGVQREISLEVIEYGNPDGGGDLKRNNQIAIRSEIVYGWGFQDLAAVAKLIDDQS